MDFLKCRAAGVREEAGRYSGKWCIFVTDRPPTSGYMCDVAEPVALFLEPAFSHENVVVELGSCLSFTAFAIACVFFLILFISVINSSQRW